MDKKGIWAYLRPIRGRRGFPPWAMRQGRGPHSQGRHTPPSKGFSPTWGRGGGCHPLAYIRRGRVPLFHHSIKFFSSLFLPPSSDSPCLEFALGRGFLHHTHAIALPGSGSESVIFPLLTWFGARREHRLRHTCVIP